MPLRQRRRDLLILQYHQIVLAKLLGRPLLSLQLFQVLLIQLTNGGVLHP